MNFHFKRNSPLLKNTPTHEIVKRLMLHRYKFLISFGSACIDYSYVLLETKGVSAITYRLNTHSLQWLISYLQYGKTEDMGINPEENDLPKQEVAEAELFRELVMKQIPISYTPLFRENTGIIEATARFQYGCIRFRIKRNEEWLEFLKNNQQPINLLVG